MTDFDDSTYLGKRRNGLFYPNKPSRMAQLATNNLGIIQVNDSKTSLKIRNPEIELLDKYYESTQYDHLQKWDDACCDEDYVAIRKRKPRIIYNFAKVLSSRIASKLVGQNNFPSFTVQDDPETTEFLKVIRNMSMMQARLMEPVRRMICTGSSFVRFYIVERAIKVEWYNAKYCYPKFDEIGELAEVEIKYVYADENDKDKKGDPKPKWYKLIIGTMSDIIFDNPEYSPGKEPIFNEMDRIDHGLGFVQGEWLRTDEQKHTVDGPSLIVEILDFIDELNYSLSQSSQAVQYNQDPQLILSSMNEDDIDNLIRSSTKAWNLGREGDAKFLESNLGGVERAGDLRDKIRLGIQDIARVILLDPEKLSAHAQSGKAMEIMHGPFVELINEIRPQLEHRLISLQTKMAIAILRLKLDGLDGPITMPEGYSPTSLAITCDWPPIFPLTMFDLKEMIAVVTAATSANILSREWGTRFLAKHKEFNIDNVEDEISRVDTQKVINPFGAF